MKPCGLFYLIQTAIYLVVVLKAVSKIKAFTILIGFVSGRSAVLKNIFFLSSLLLLFLKIHVKLVSS
jgi:hypothetical protein